MLTTFKTLLSNKTQLNSTTYLYHFDLIEPKEIIFKAGQYLVLKVPSEKGPVSRLYSIASPNAVKNSFELIIGIIPGGLASNYLFSLKENSEIIFQGPAGMFGLKDDTREKVFLVTGTGIAPVRSMLKSTLDVGGLKLDKEVGNLMLEDQSSNFQSQNPASNFQHQTSIFLFWGLKTYKDVYLFDELKKLTTTVIPAKAGIQFKICLSREENLDMVPRVDKKFFELGRVNDCFNRYIKNCKLKIENLDFYLCGGRQIVESLRQFLVAKNVSKENI